MDLREVDDPDDGADASGPLAAGALAGVLLLVAAAAAAAAAPALGGSASFSPLDLEFPRTCLFFSKSSLNLRSSCVFAAGVVAAAPLPRSCALAADA